MNILKAMVAIIDNNNFRINGERTGTLSRNGKGLEDFVLQAFSESFDLEGNAYDEKLHEVFSYIGAGNKPPDAMIRRGAAIEIKKIESSSTTHIQFNSSMPKNALQSTDPMISVKCRNAEEWNRKEIVYAVGIVIESVLRHIFFVYGVDYCPANSCETATRMLKAGIRSIPDLPVEDSNELGRINNVDHLGNTYLRIRGMWAMKTPWRVFDIPIDDNKRFTMTAVMNNDILSVEKENSGISEADLLGKGVSIQDFTIQNPDNPQSSKPGKLITYSIP